MEGFANVPGPRGKGSGGVWAGSFMFLTSAIGQLGGILGGVGQLFADAFPITGDFDQQLNGIETAYKEWQIAVTKAKQSGLPEPKFVKPAPGQTWDDVYYSVIITVVTA